MKHLLLGIFILLAAPVALAQKQYVQEQQLWLGLFNQTRFSQHWGSWTDLHLRTHEQFVHSLFQGVARAGITYYLTDDVRLTGGYAYVHHFPEGVRTVGQPEHRPWQQVQWFTRFPKARLMQWVRLEERFRRQVLNNADLGEDFNFNYRTRYNAALFLPLTKAGFEPGGLQFLLNDELMVNFGEEIRYNYVRPKPAVCGFGLPGEQASLNPGRLYAPVSAIAGWQCVPQPAQHPAFLFS